MSDPAAPWLALSRKRIFLDMHLPAWPGKGIAGGFEPRKLAHAIAGSGADSAVLFAKCQYGNFYTKLPGESLHPGLAGVDFLEETSLALRQKGVRSLAYYSVSWDERFADERPEWLAQKASGAKDTGPYRWRTLCINGPYADVVQRHLEDIARKSLDGIWLDMTIVGEGNCHCPRCREGFRRAYGREPPVETGDPLHADFLKFRYDIVEAFYRRIRAAVRAVAPDIVFTNNYWGYPWSSAEMGSRAVGAAAAADFLTGEAYSDWTGIRSVSMLPIFLRSAAAGRPFESLIGTSVNTWDYTRKPGAYLSYEAFSVFAHGAAVTVDDEPFHDGSIDESLYRGELKAIFSDVSSLAESVAGRHARYATVYHSQRTKDRCVDQRDFVKDICGAFRLLRDLAFPVDFTFDESPGRLSDGCALLVLPGVTHLTGGEWDLLEGCMRKGGLVVAAGGLGGDAAVVRALAGLGIEGGSPSDYTLSYLRLPGDRSRDILVRGRYASYAAGRGLPAGGAQGEVIDPICETSTAVFFHNNLPAPYSRSGVPAILEVPVGRGAFVLLPQPVFRHYAKEPSAPLREVIGSLVSRRLPPPRIGLRIPRRLDFSIVEGPDAMYVHLLNPSVEPSLCCGLMDIYEGRFERSYEYMEEEVPVHDLRILVRRDRIGRVSAIREKSPVETHRAADGWEILVKRVSLWEVVKIELGPGEWLAAGDWSWR